MRRKTSSMRFGETAVAERITLRLCAGGVRGPLRVARKAGWSTPVNSIMFVVRPEVASTRLETSAPPRFESDEKVADAARESPSSRRMSGVRFTQGRHTR